METLPCNSFTPITVGVSLSLIMFISVIYFLCGTSLGKMCCGSTLFHLHLSNRGYD
jgi:hypothetical protein